MVACVFESSRCEPETRLYALWEARAVTGARLRALGGEEVIVLSRGARNDGPGPDYRDAVLVVAGRLVVGAVEMHRVESDWFAHGHDRDPAYRTVILHLLGAAPAKRTLALPTVIAAALEPDSLEANESEPGPATRGSSGPGSTIAGREASDGSATAISRELLCDAAWTRLLRRVTEIVREDTSLDIETRMRRAFVARLFDCLGYSANRAPMRALAARIIDDGVLASGAGFDAIAALLFGYGGSDIRIVRDLGAGFMSDTRLERIVAARPAPLDGVRWSRSTRPANAPERRLWAAARLLAEIAGARRLERLLDRVAAGATWHQIERELVVRFGAESFVGVNRAGEIVINALLPVALAAGVLADRTALIEHACRLYRAAPAQQTNRTLRQVERRYLGGRSLTGGFWQQGAIEHYQRYLSPDRSALRFLADQRSHYSPKRPPD